MFVAGILSALLGIGSGIIKVLAMDQLMRLPFKVSTTTSNFMIGVTAAASAGVYLHRGYIDPTLAFPVMLGVLGGALLGRATARRHKHEAGFARSSPRSSCSPHSRCCTGAARDRYEPTPNIALDATTPSSS